MPQPSINAAELPIDADGRVYHLKLKPEELAKYIITVGDPERVEWVSAHFDSIEHRVQHREFITHTGSYRGQPISVISTGMGTSNIDIVMNELDALANIDFKSRQVKPSLTSLQILRLGTTGCVDENVSMGTLVASHKAVGLDGLMHFYRWGNDTDSAMTKALIEHCRPMVLPIAPYVVGANPQLREYFNDVTMPGITVTSIGFYGPQNRQLRGAIAQPGMLDKLRTFQYGTLKVLNFEMETAATFAMGQMLGHRCHSISTVIANRISGEFCVDIGQAIERMITVVFEKLS